MFAIHVDYIVEYYFVFTRIRKKGTMSLVVIYMEE